MTGASVFNLQTILSLSLSLLVTSGPTVPSTALLLPVTGLAHPISTPINHFKAELQFYFSWSLVCVLQPRILKGLTWDWPLSSSRIQLHEATFHQPLYVYAETHRRHRLPAVSHCSMPAFQPCLTLDLSSRIPLSCTTSLGWAPAAGRDVPPDSASSAGLERAARK